MVEKNYTTSHQIIPTHSDVMVVSSPKEGKKEWVVEKIPTWVSRRFGKTPSEIEGKPLKESLKNIPELNNTFLVILEDIDKNNIPVIDYCVEFDDFEGKRKAILISANKYESLSPEKIPRANLPTAADETKDTKSIILFKLREVTESVITRKRYISIGNFHGIIGSSKVMLTVYHKIEVYGPVDAPVVITGETGTGKELVARAIHYRSKRKTYPFVAVNCTALNEDLFESELFGHEKGAFTGAIKSHKGRFERADKGTLFLDEIGDMPIRTQAKFLRVLEFGKVERVGSEEERPVNVRIIAATNIPLEEAVGMRRFRADLYHRIAVFRIHIPALREHIEDIPLLVEHFLKIFNDTYNKKIIRLTAEAIHLLQEYYWPGNIRELRNVLERVYVEARTPIIGRNAFNEWVKERDYFAAGQWNLQQLERKRSSPVIVSPSQFPLSKLPQPDSQAFQPSERPSFPASEEDIFAHTADLSPPIEKGEFEGFYPQGDFPSSFPEEISAASITPPLTTIDADYTVKHTSTKKRKNIGVKEMESALKRANGNITQASKLLGIHKATFYRRLNSLNLQRSDLLKSSDSEEEK